MKYTLKIYETKSKDLPFYNWLEKQDKTVKYLIVAKLERVSLGNFNNCKFLGDGISEVKIDS